MAEEERESAGTSDRWTIRWKEDMSWGWYWDVEGPSENLNDGDVVMLVTEHDAEVGRAVNAALDFIGGRVDLDASLWRGALLAARAAAS